MRALLCLTFSFLRRSFLCLRYNATIIPAIESTPPTHNVMVPESDSGFSDTSEGNPYATKRIILVTNATMPIASRIRPGSVALLVESRVCSDSARILVLLASILDLSGCFELVAAGYGLLHVISL